MGKLDYQRTVFAYHGCDQSVADKILAGGQFRPSDNDYDWLGRGVYLWEYGPARALDWATAEHRRDTKKVEQPAVVGAVVHLGRCFDLLDVRYTDLLAQLHPEFIRTLQEAGKPIPENRGLETAPADLVLRRLDCAMINWAVSQFEAQTGTSVQSVRGVFVEGERAFPDSCIHRKSHIQVAVRDPECIVGVFRPVA